MVKLKCNSCGVINITTTIFGVVCTSCKKSLDMFNTTFIPEDVLFGSTSHNYDQKVSFALPRFPGFSASKPIAPLKDEVDLEKDAAAAKENLDRVLSEVKSLEEKVERGKTYKKKLSELFSSDSFMSPAAIEKARKEIDALNAEIKRSDTINQRINQLTKEISDLRKSPDYKLLDQRLNIRQKTFALETKITKACKVQEEIAELEKNQHFLQDTEVQKLEKKLDSILKILGQDKRPETVKKESTQTASQDRISEVLLVQERARRNLECVICLDVPMGNSQVFSCVNHHLLCSGCAPNPSLLGRCPVCRQDFNKIPPTRNRLAEKMLQELC